MRVLQAYFTPLSGRDTGFTGGAWDTFDPSGTRATSRDVFTADDLLSCSLLSTPIPGRAAMELLVRQPATFTQMLSAIPDDREFADVPDTHGPEFQPVRVLYAALRELPRLGPTRATKLLARKRPRLVPIVDSVVRSAMPPRTTSHWALLHAALTNDGGALQERLLDLRSKAGLSDDVSALRVFDVLVWMDGSGNADRVLRGQEIRSVESNTDE
ncbi:DUF6308 family protein [Arsenicicoccus piscis]|uniref:Uncharacterized protein n=1 Tax=Arsenicicoccus piscis TaxID=673954 RepID=A0ABQ6HVU8_9MICO|nr:DUF6308 family protein [Arsenicicoccus piscis]GMA21524.1 hypothetical protein GCM10025862_35450 [Arsenicicoccus piscis]GMA22156.1 hypothetical protein GCM10025862_41790 [Arsenicicoccus piscis]GMA22203.1 hypothetical protein GCM10025862_42260 [Arsenicicoccus piscis]